jgi:hypothetical protein
MFTDIAVERLHAISCDVGAVGFWWLTQESCQSSCWCVFLDWLVEDGWDLDLVQLDCFFCILISLFLWDVWDLAVLAECCDCVVDCGPEAVVG